MKNVIIIGAGFGGLACANILASRGMNVTVLEKNNEPGGRARVWKKDGFTFDMGPSWYLMPEVFERYFEQFGKKRADYYALSELDPYYTVFFEKHRAAVVTADLKKTQKLFDSFEHDGSAKLKKYLEAARYKYDIAMKDFLYRDYGKLIDFFNRQVMTEGLKMNLFGSLDSFVRKYFSDTRSRQILEYAMVFLGNSPDNAPALYSIMSHVDLGLGVHYPAGGMGKITEGLMKLGRSLGVQYRMNEAVMKITSDGKRVRSVHTSRDTYPADIVVANADYAHVETQLLDEKDRSYPPRYWKKRTYAPSMFIAYLGLSKKLKKLSHHNLYFSEEWQNHFSTIFTTKQWPTNPCFYLSCPSVTDASVAPRGKENLFLLIPIAPGLEDSDEIREKYFDMALAHVEKITGEKIRANIEVKRIYSLNDYRNDYNAWDGTALGLSHTLMQTAIFRPKRRSGKLSNLYYCSQYTHPGVGVPMTFIAAQIAAERISKDYAL